MARKLIFGTSRTPPPLKFWMPTRGQANIRWLPDNEFEVLARKYGVAIDKAAFTIWGQWWQPKKIIFRATHLRRLILHEARHVEEGHFHEE